MPDLDTPKIGKYEIQADLGQGGFGKVYRAFDPTVGRPVAIKILTAEGNPDLLTRFRNEATAAGKLKHRNIVTIYEFGEYDGRPFMVMELLEGQDLVQVIKDGVKLSLLQKMNIMDQVADGLDCAHRNGIIHRDVKPGNIRLLPDGTVKIMDFGVARMSRERDETRLTQQGDLIGTILYMSPEQFSGGGADVLSDVFAYGVTYYELLTGQHPFKSTDPARVMFKISMEDPAPVRSLVPECPAALEQIINRAMQKDRVMRYQGLRDLRVDTEPLLFELEQEKASSLALEAQRLYDAGDYNGALSIIHETLSLDPGNREVRQLRETVQRELQRQALGARLQVLLQTAEEQLARREFAPAVQTLESALKLDPANARARESLDAARADLQRLKDSARMAASALADLRKKDFAAAFEKASEAARLDPLNKEAGHVLAEVQKHNVILERLREIDALRSRGDWDTAVAELRHLASLYPDSREVRSFLEETVSRQTAARRIGAASAQAKQFIDQARFADAVECVSEALRDFPEEAGLLALLAEAKHALADLRRTEAIEQALRTAQSMQEAKDFDGALQELDRALLEFSGEPRLAELRSAVSIAKADWERDVFIGGIVQRSEELGVARRFSEALEAVQAGLSRYKQDPTLLQLEAGLLQVRDRHQQAEAARRSMEAGRPQEAVEALEKALSRDSEATELQELLSRAKLDVQAQKRNQAVERAARQAKARTDRSDFRGALQILEKALGSWPGEARLADLIQATEAQRAAYEREQAIAKIEREAKSLAADQRFGEALRIVEGGLRTYERAPALSELQQRILADRQQKQRTEAIARRIEEGQALLSEGRTKLAVDAIENACAKYPEAAELQRLLAQAHERQQAVERAAREARGWTDRHDFDQALQVLDRALESWPGEVRLLELVATTQQVAKQHQLEREHQEQLEQQRRAEAVARHFQEAQRLLSEFQTAQAVEMLEKACAEFPEASELQSLLAQARERQQAVENAAREAQALAGRHEFSQAIEIVEQALQSWPGEPRLLELITTTQAAQAAYEREQVIAEIDREAKRLAADQRYEEALRFVEEGLRTHEGEPALSQLQQGILSEWQQKQRAEAIAQCVEEGQRLLSQGQTRLAVEALEKGSQQCRDASELQGLLAQARKRQKAIEGAEQEAQAFAGRHDFSRALQTLEKALGAWPGEVRLLELLDATREAARQYQIEQELRDQAERQRRAEAIARLVQEGQRLLSERQTAQAVEMLEKACAQYPEASDLQALRAQAAQAAYEREQAIGQMLREAKRLAAGQRYEEALRVVREGLRTYEREAVLMQLEQEIQAQWQQQQRAAAIAQCVEEGRRLLSQGQTELAVTALEQSSQQYPEAGEIQNLLKQARQRKEGVTRAARDAQRHMGRQDFGRAVEILRKAGQSWPGDAGIEDLLASATQAQAAKERESALGSVVRQANQLAAKRRFPEALTIIRSAMQTYEQAPPLLELERRIIEQQERSLPDASVQTPPPASVNPPSVLRSRFVVIGLCGVVLLAGGWIAWHAFRSERVVAVALSSNVAGASVVVGNKSCVMPDCSLSLPAGTYRLAATKDGFQPLSQTITVRNSGTELKIPLAFEPLPQLVQVNTNFASGQVFLDGHRAGDLRDGQFSLSGVSPGPHKIRVTSGDAQFETEWRSAIGASPELQQPFTAKNVQATLITNVGRNGSVLCNCDVKAVKLDGNTIPSTNSGAQGIQLTGLKEGTQQISIGDRSLIADLKPNPTLNVFLALDSNTGTLVIKSSENGAKVYINNRPYHRLTDGGSIRIPLDVGRYTVRVEKTGFRPATPQTVDVAKGEDQQIAFVLAPVPPALDLTGVLPGAQVKVDGQAVGETDSSGSFRTEVSAGNHVIELTKQGYTDAQFTSGFAPGRTVRPDRAQLTMTKVVKPPPPPAPVSAPTESKPTEAEDWNRVRNSNNPDEIEDFIRKHPGGADINDARNRLAQLRAQMEAAAAKQAEQTAWNRLDKANKAAVQDFLAHYGAGPHATDARALIAGIEQQEAAKEQQQELAKRAAADDRAIVGTLSAYEAAYNAKDLKGLQSVWQEMPKDMAEATRREFGASKTIGFQIRPLNKPTINGNSATVDCTRTLSLTLKQGGKQEMPGERVKVTLARVNSGWLIQSITPY